MRPFVDERKRSDVWRFKDESDLLDQPTRGFLLTVVVLIALTVGFWLGRMSESCNGSSSPASPTYGRFGHL